MSSVNDLSILLVAVIALLIAFTGSAPSHPFTDIKEVHPNMDSIISELASPQVSEKDKFRMVVLSDEATQAKLYESLMRELDRDPERNLSAWESWLLSANGQRVSVRLLKPDGSEVGLDDIKTLLDKMVGVGKPLTVEEFLEREGISVRHQWIRTKE